MTDRSVPSKPAVKPYRASGGERSRPGRAPAFPAGPRDQLSIFDALAAYNVSDPGGCQGRSDDQTDWPRHNVRRKG